jgi:hypothetical protein
MGAVCGGLALAFVAVALVVGLRGVPSQAAAGAPAVAIAVLITRTVVAAGMLWLGYVLFRMGERFYSEGIRGLPGK